ncbi:MULTISPECIES: hypothetical protein [Streptomyces]|uniref:hypothetical protein n=1 Tax=Streptomyces lycopersici TaxID=2974589 RepID=UPI003523F4FA
MPESASPFFTDHGQPAAILINPQELADLEDALALAQYRARQASGETTGVPHEQVLTEPKWAKKLTDEDRRGLTALFWSNVNPYGIFRLVL